MHYTQLSVWFVDADSNNGFLFVTTQVMDSLFIAVWSLQSEDLVCKLCAMHSGVF